MSFDIDEMNQVLCPFCGAMFDTILSDVVECPCCGAEIDLTERGENETILPSGGLGCGCLKNETLSPDSA